MTQEQKVDEKMPEDKTSEEKTEESTETNEEGTQEETQEESQKETQEAAKEENYKPRRRSNIKKVLADKNELAQKNAELAKENEELRGQVEGGSEQEQELSMDELVDIKMIARESGLSRKDEDKFKTLAVNNPDVDLDEIAKWINPVKTEQATNTANGMMGKSKPQVASKELTEGEKIAKDIAIKYEAHRNKKPAWQK